MFSPRGAVMDPGCLGRTPAFRGGYCGIDKEEMGRSGYGVRSEPLKYSYVLSYAWRMRTMTASMARANLYRLLEETAESSEPVQITGKKGSSVLVSEKDWRALQETVYLLSVPG